MEWSDMTNEQIAGNEEAAEARKVAFVNTFYATKDGQDVLLYLTRMVLDYEVLPIRVEETAGIKLAIREFLDHIKDCCGLDDKRAVIEAEAAAVT
jgi:hypothetical protein